MSSTQGIQAEVPTAVFGPVTGDIYQRQMGRWSRRLAEPFLDFVAANLHGAAALDIGCGTGSLSFAMARRDPTASVTGCDISEALLAHGRAANPYPDRVRFGFLQVERVHIDRGDRVGVAKTLGQQPVE